MFKVKHKETGQVRTVYGYDEVSVKSLWFLTYYDGEWTWIDSANYVPYEEES